MRTLREDVGPGLVGVDDFENVFVAGTHAGHVAVMRHQSADHRFFRRAVDWLEPRRDRSVRRPVKRRVVYVCISYTLQHFHPIITNKVSSKLRVRAETGGGHGQDMSPII